MTEVYIIGPSSTGKTTLCRALAATLGLEESTVISEVARDVMRGSGYTREDVGMLEMQAAIMGAQLLRERQARAAASQSRRILLSDRSAIDPIAYAVLSSASKEEAEGRVQYLSNSSQFQSALLAYRQSVVVLLAPVPEWLMDDGVRNIENQDQCFAVFKDLLKRFGIHYREIGPEMKNLTERAAVVKNLARV